ncbi:pyrroloquinoline quinone biosynthesis protein PqqF [Pseudomonas sp. C11]|uniref:pyrroloquinoline quinone biosynthesis protein PqqF n=1 Tax=Pseudomonas sp. C11 TaxID=3075550 RepID=UPI002AFEDB16|nr:pyrroloquinoline quinone biosynthesis protein PqqF [Pseudomonas sp. C11]
MDNGAVLHVVQQPWARQAGVCLRVTAGSHDEPEGYPGLAHFLEHLLFLGSHDYPVDQGLMAYVRRCGGLVNASTRARHTDFLCQVPAARLAPTLQRLQSLLARPLFEIEAQRREREVLHAEYQARSQDADSRIEHALGQALAAGHRCADFLAGERESLPVEQGAFQQALRRYHRGHYQACNMSLVLVGPQPVEELLALGEACLLAMPVVESPTVRPCASLLPLRAPRLLLQQADTGLILGQALELDDLGLEPALQLWLDALHDPGPGSLQDQLRRAGLCQGLQARLLYRHRGQRLLRIDCPGANAQGAAALQAEWLAWLQRLRGHAAWPERLQAWSRLQALRGDALAPLALAQHLQDQQPEADARVLLALDKLLEQLASGTGLIELLGSPEPQPNWTAVGLDLPLLALPAQTLPPARLQSTLADVAVLPSPSANRQSLPQVALRWHPGPAQGDPAALYWRAPIVADDASLPARLAMLQARIAEQASLCQRHGVELHLQVEPDAWSLALSGAGEWLAASSACLLPLLLAPLSAGGAPAPSGQLLRQLLQQLPLLGQGETASCLQGLGVGLDGAAQRQVEALFVQVDALADAGMPIPLAEAMRWRELALLGEEWALLLFCPLPVADAAHEAAWRLLDQCLQEAFYQRLRGELQLGYALFSGFRQVRGQRGLLFGVQSPHCEASGLFAHIRHFLEQQPARLAELTPTAFASARAALQQSLELPRSHVEWAEQLWLAHRAGLPADHPLHLVQAVASLDQAALQRACRDLLLERGWQVLASVPSTR